MSEHTVHINSEEKCEKCGCGPKERLASCPGKPLTSSEKKAIRKGKVEEITTHWAKIVRAAYNSE